MKLSRITSLIVAAVGVVAATGEHLLRGAEESRALRDIDFDQLEVYYDPKAGKDKKCYVLYEVNGYDEVKVFFDDDQINEDGDKVVCKKKKEEEEGAGPTFEADVDLDDATWKGEVPRDADVRWYKDDKDRPTLLVQIKKFTDWEAYYDEDGDDDKKCYLQYKYKKNDITKVYFRDSNVSERTEDRVVCKKKDYDDFPVTLTKVEKDVTKDAEWRPDEEVKRALVSWSDSDKGDLKLVIVKKPNGKPEDIEWEAFYDPRGKKDEKCYLKYTIDDNEYTVRFNDGNIRKDGNDKVICERKKDFEGRRKLPFEEDITDDTTWKGKNGNEEIEEAMVKWFGGKDDERVRLTIEKKPGGRGEAEWKGYYDPDGKKDEKCYLKYTIRRKEYVVKFRDRDIKETGDDKVTCERKEDFKGRRQLPFEEDITDDTTWKDETVKKSIVRWFLDNKDDERVRLTIEKKSDGRAEAEWEGYYNPDGAKDDKCYLMYTIKGKDYKVKFRDNEIRQDRNRVFCGTYEDPKGGLAFPVDEIITDDVEWKAREVLFSRVRWYLERRSRRKRVVLVIRARPDRGGRLNWRSYYDPKASKDKKCWLKYAIGRRAWTTVWFDDDEVKQRGNTVECVKDDERARAGLNLPQSADITDYAEWKGSTVKDADVDWDNDGKYPNSGKLTVTMTREGKGRNEDVEWEAVYFPNGNDNGTKCILRYRVDGKDYRFRFDNKDVDEKVRRKLVVCTANGVYNLSGGLTPPVTTDIDAQWKGGVTVDDADLVWRKTGLLRVTIESD